MPVTACHSEGVRRSGRPKNLSCSLLPVLRGRNRFLLTFVFILLTGCGTKQHAFPPATAVDRIVIVKSMHSMTLMQHGKILEVYKVSLGRSSGDKRQQGDHKTPAGLYLIDSKKSKSRFDLALHISYPNENDRIRAKALGVNPGGDIEIHGLERGLGWLGGAQRSVDWTDGCIAVTDAEIEEIWPVVPIGTVVEIRD